MSNQPIAKASTCTQHRKTRTNIHALSGIRTYDLSVQTIKAYASDCSSTGTCFHFQNEYVGIHWYCVTIHVVPTACSSTGKTEWLRLWCEYSHYLSCKRKPHKSPDLTFHCDSSLRFHRVKTFITTSVKWNRLTRSRPRENSLKVVCM
jgi:hypothetical protein